MAEYVFNHGSTVEFYRIFATEYGGVNPEPAGAAQKPSGYKFGITIAYWAAAAR